MMLTAAETLLWRGQRLAPESPLYNMAMALEVEGELDSERLVAAFVELVREDPVLRTVFPDSDGAPTRVILPGVDARVEGLDWPGERVSEAEAWEALEDRTRRAFDLGRGPLVDAAVVRRGPQRWLLFINQHHLITDALSVSVLFRRWADAYRRLGSGHSEGREAPPDFDAYVRHEHSLRSSERLSGAREFWRKRGEVANSSPPVYGSRGSGSGRTRRVRVPLGPELSAAVRERSAEPPFRALTPAQGRYQLFATLVLAWLTRVTGASRPVLGTPWHHRSSASLKQSLGLFIELLPLSVTVADDETFASLAEKVAAVTREGIRHVVPGASADRGARDFSTVLNVITADLGEFAGLPARANWIHSGYGDPAHRMRVQVHDFGATGETTLDFDLDEAVFDEAAQRWTVEHMGTLLQALVADPDQPIARIALADWSDEVEWAPRGREAACPASVLEAFHEWADTAGEAVAVVHGDESISYDELDRRARALASGLRARGVGPGTPVGICLDRSVDLVVAVVGVLAAGAVFVPLDPHHPAGRGRDVLNDAGVRLVLASRSSTLGAGLEVVDPSELYQGREPLARREPGADDLAYVLYTSGSTGRPKGVEVRHGSLADYVAWAARTYSGEGRLRWPLFTSPAFDLTLTSLFTPLATGGTIVVYDDEDGGGFAVRRVFEDDDVDVVKMTPSHLAVIQDLDLTDSRVRRIVLGGEALTTDAARRTLEKFGGGVELFNEYGPTEATVACMIHRYDPRSDQGDTVPIGLPADNARIHVLDAAGNPVPRGAVGEIAVAGPRVARGYRGRPHLTARAFVPDPVDPDARMYRTGDLGRWTAEGPMEFLGRLDDQVKVRGVRVELGEVEAALARHPAVSEAAAAMIDGSSGVAAHCRLCGLQGAHPEARLDSDGVCAVCRRFEREKERVSAYFTDMDELRRLLRRARERAAGEHDTLLLLSGGKDSTYALCRIVELGARPLVFMLDNGFISDQAKANARRVTDQLGLEFVLGRTPAMPEIFADSLARFSDVCDGCFKTIYTLALKLAVERGIPTIVTGLSRGQIVETRLADLYRRGIDDPREVDRMILDARKAYHRMDDAVSRCLDTRLFDADDVLDRIEFVDFYRYSDVSLDELLAYVAEHTPWIRPSDTGRSTNCLINQAGIFVHQQERGYHNYTMPYSWDVRLGHKERDAALAELDDELDPVEIRRMLDEVGYREKPPVRPESRLVAWYTADRDVPVAELRSRLAEVLPLEAIPSEFHRVDTMPLTRAGKVDRAALPRPAPGRQVVGAPPVAPRTPVERRLTRIWSEVLGREPIGVEDDFFELGGDSMDSIQIVGLARSEGLVLTARDLFAHPTIASLAEVVSVAEPDAGSAVTPATATAEELAELEAELGE